MNYEFQVGQEVRATDDLPCADGTWAAAGAEGRIASRDKDGIFGHVPVYTVQIMNLNGFDTMAFAFQYMLEAKI
jgi:hypothetical protein